MDRRPDGGGAAEAEPDGRPSVSVVVASHGGKELLGECLRSLLPQCRSLEAELVVARPRGTDDQAWIREAFPEVRVASAPAEADVPRLRAAGIDVARGDVVALTEDHCLAGEGWLRSLVAAQREGAEVAGGPMGNARRARTVDWAAFFAEYGFFAEAGGPGAGTTGSPPALTGANVSYARPLLDRVVRRAGRGEWENVIHDEFAAEGRTLRFVEDAVVSTNRSWRILEFCGDRFRHGLGYARRRISLAPGFRRWLYLAGTPLLPPILAARIAGAAGSREPRAFVRSLPLILVFLAAWALGEAAGYLSGPTSLRTDPATAEARHGS